MKKFISVFLSFVLLAGLLPLGALNARAATSANVSSTAAQSGYQVEYPGDSKPIVDGSDILISKTAVPVMTDHDNDASTPQVPLENYFDVTLEVTSPPHTHQYSTAVVLVLDISNTMNYQCSTHTSGTKLLHAKEGINKFFDALSKNQTIEGKKEVSVVTFNTHAQVADGFIDSQTKNLIELTSSNLTTLQGYVNSITAPTEYGSTKSEINQNNLKSKDGIKYTNMEAGLQLAYNILKDADADHKYIVLATDGFPTTYIDDCFTTSTPSTSIDAILTRSASNNRNDINKIFGHDPFQVTLNTDGTTTKWAYDSRMLDQRSDGAWVPKDGFFVDTIKSYTLSDGTTSISHPEYRMSSYGNNYSDKAAEKAAAVAQKIKQNNISIFSLGIDIHGQSIKEYVDESAYVKGNSANGVNHEFSTVDRHDTTYETHTQGKLDATDERSYYANWLKEKISGGPHGLAHKYWDTSVKQEALEEAFTEILEDIQTVSTAPFSNAVVSDPMGPNIEFLGFHKYSGSGVNRIYSYNSGLSALTGKYADCINADGENEAQFDQTTNYVTWWVSDSAATNPKQSGWIDTGRKDNHGNTIYSLKLTYRVRIKNETGSFLYADASNAAASSFAPINNDYTQAKAAIATEPDYQTNGVTTFKYRDYDPHNHAEKQSNFVIPAVEAYKGSFSFDKKDAGGNPLNGAEFTLVHNGNDCSVCRAAGTTVAINDQKVISGMPDGTGAYTNPGKVMFDNIPSGHDYTLKETSAPIDHKLSAAEYLVTVSYGETKVYDTNGGIMYDSINNIVTTITNEKLNNIEVTLTAKKLLENSSVPQDKKGDFSFELVYVPDSADRTNDIPVVTVPVDDNDIATFPALKFGPDEVPGATGEIPATFGLELDPKISNDSEIFNFVIREIIPANEQNGWFEDVIYTNAEIPVAVTLKLNGTGDAYVASVDYTTPANVSVDAGNANQVVVNNTLRPEVKLPLAVSKQVVDITGNTNDINMSSESFAFNLYALNDSNQFSVVKTITANGGGTAVFEPNDIADLVFDHSGDYVFYITETADSSKSDIVYDDTIYRIDVNVPLPVDAQGKPDNTSAYTISKVTVSTTDSVCGNAVGNIVSYTPVFDSDNNAKINTSENITVTFENRERKEITVPFVLRKLFDGTAYSGDDYLFRLTDKSNPADVVYYAKAGTNGFIQFTDDTASTPVKVFPVIEKIYGKSDVGKTYRYIIEEINQGNEKIIYDDSVYDVSITISAPNKKGVESYVATVTILKDGAAYEQYSVYAEYNAAEGKFIYPDAVNEKGLVEFKNTTRPPAEVFFYACKYVNFRTPGADENFTFVLTETTGGVEKVIAEKTNVGELINFATLYYDKSGTYTYRINERHGSIENMIYDDTEFIISVHVTADVKSDKPFSATTVIYKNGKLYTDKEAPVFQNIRTVNTGDPSNLILLAAITAISAAAIVAIIIKKRRESHN